jgi:transcriptional regulator with XRE-family HTH domain
MYFYLLLIDTMSENIYKTIREIRLQKGLTQQYMADKIGISQNNYGKLERGLIQLTLERLIEIATEFQMSPLNLFTLCIADKYIERTGESETEEKTAILLERLQIQQDKVALLEETGDFRVQQIESLLTFIKSIVSLVPQVKKMAESTEEESKIYFDYLLKIKIHSEKIAGKLHKS